MAAALSGFYAVFMPIPPELLKKETALAVMESGRRTKPLPGRNHATGNRQVDLADAGIELGSRA